MGARGPKPRPQHLKVLQGEQESRINRNEPLPGEGQAVAPAGMTEGALRVWAEWAPDLMDKGMLSPWDIYAFEAFCEAVAQFRECRTLLQQQTAYGKYIDKGAAGGVIKSPYHQMMRDCIETMSKIGGRFGFTPGDRANLAIEKSDHGPKSGAERILS
jgi:P27 family predicted phage terminase small subunit